MKLINRKVIKNILHSYMKEKYNYSIYILFLLSICQGKDKIVNVIDETKLLLSHYTSLLLVICPIITICCRM